MKQNKKPSIFKRCYTFFLSLLCGYRVTGWASWESNGNTHWVPLKKRDRDHWYQQREIKLMENHKWRMDQFVKAVLKIDWRKLHKPFEV